MPLHKVWNSTRTLKKFVVAESLDHLKKSGQVKLKLKPCTHIIDLTLVLEKDGTIVDEDEILNELQGDTLMILEPGESWNSAASDDINVTVSTCTSPAEIVSEQPMATPSSTNSESNCSTHIQPFPTTPTSRRHLSPMSQRLKMSDTHTSRSFTVPLPKLSTFVHESLLAGRILDCLNNLVAECANFYISSHELTSSSQYKEVGKQLFQRYPCIRFPQGAEPWSLFCEKLSQKMRNMRFQQKRKSDGNVGRSPKQPRFGRVTMTNLTGVQVISEEDYNKHVVELSEEVKKSNPDKFHMQILLKETFKMRREWLSKQPSGSWAPLIAAFPCFKDIEQLEFEYEMMRGRKTLEEEMQNMGMLFQAIEKFMERKPQGSDAEKTLHVIHYMEKATAFEKGKGKKTETVLNIQKDVAEDRILRKCETKELSAPSLICFFHGDNISELAIVGDGQTIFCHTTDLKMGLLYLVHTYYISDLEYPRQLSQLLGLLQQYVVKEQYSCCVSVKFRKLSAMLEKELEKEAQ